MDKHLDSIHPATIWKNSDPIDLTKPRKKSIVLYFWRSQTPASVEVLHGLQHLINTFGQEDFPVDVVAVHAPEFHDETDPWEDVVKDFSITLPVVHDPYFATWERFGVHAAPSFVVLDKQGKEVLRAVGDIDQSGIAKYIYSLL